MSEQRARQKKVRGAAAMQAKDIVRQVQWGYRNEEHVWSMEVAMVKGHRCQLRF